MGIFALSLLLFFFFLQWMCITLVMRKKLLIKKFKICVNFPLTFSQLQLEHTGREKGTCSSFATGLLIFLCKNLLLISLENWRNDHVGSLNTNPCIKITWACLHKRWNAGPHVMVMGLRSMHVYHTPQVFLMHNPVWDSPFWLQVSSCIFILQWLKHLLDCFFSSSKFLMNACPHNIHFIVGDTEDWMFSLKCKN